VNRRKSKNKYFVCIKNQPPFEFDPCSDEPLFSIDPHFFSIYLKSNYFIYFSKIFSFMEEHIEISGITFYLAWSNVQELPSYGKPVIVIAVEDEWCRIPIYFNRVGATFKCYGIKPTLGCNFILNPSFLNFLTTIQFVRTWLVRLPSLINYILQKSKVLFSQNSSVRPIYDIPLGYANQLNHFVPMKKFLNFYW
jgi:hypothetical protein